MEFMLIVNDDLIWVEGKNKTSPCTSQQRRECFRKLRGDRRARIAGVEKVFSFLSGA